MANKNKQNSPIEKTVFILNPQSAAGTTRRRFERSRGRFQAVFPNMEVLLTQAPGHATELCAKAIRDGAQTVVVVGGDGTLNEVVNGFFDEENKPWSTSAALGILTSGTGGDFRKSFGWSLDEGEALARLKKRDVESIDVGTMWCTDKNGEKINRKWINIASFGLSGAVDEEVQKSGKSLGGKTAFLMATFRAMIGHKSAKVRLSYDDEDAVVKDVSLLALGNGQYFGGGMWMAPQADLRDGFLESIAFGDVGPRFWLLKGPKVYQGKHLDLSEVRYRRCQRLLAEPVNGDCIKIDLDGELPGQLPASFSVLPGALRLIV